MFQKCKVNLIFHVEFDIVLGKIDTICIILYHIATIPKYKQKTDRCTIEPGSKTNGELFIVWFYSALIVNEKCLFSVTCNKK